MLLRFSAVRYGLPESVKHALYYRKVLTVMAGMTLDELASYQDQKYDDRTRSVAKQRTAKKKAAKKSTRKKG